MKIINSVDSAITKGRWHNPGAKFYDTICTSKEALEEAYLVIGDKVGKDVPFTRSGCKYPHHSINKNGDLVLNVAGVRAAYQRAKQMGIFSGDVKDHLMRHYKELGIYKGSEMEADKKITENFDFIENYLGIDESKYMVETVDNSSIEELEAWIDNVAHNGFTEYTEASHTRLKYCYRIGFDKDTGEQVAVQFALEPDNITNVANKQLISDAMKLVNDKDFIEKLQKSGRNNDIKTIEKLNQTDPDIILNNKLNDTKNNIRKMGMIDFVSKAGKVINIYTKSGKQLNECNLLPLYSDSVVKYISGLKKRYGGMPTKDIFNKVGFKDDIKTICKSPISKLEHYKVGEVGGDNTYKTTLLLWDFDLFKSYRFSPMIRNHAVQGNDKDPEVALKYLKDNLDNINKTTESASFEDLVEIIESLSSTEYCWGDRIDNFYYLGESYTMYNIDNPESLDKYYLDLFYDKNNMINESFMDEYIDNYANDDNTINELLTKMDEINYDKSIQDWRLKSPSQVWNKKLGNCHDQSLYALNSLRQLGLEVGQLFFIEHNEGEGVDGNAHTLTWYKKDDEYYWFEHSWENYRGIHGPYDSLEELKSDVYKSWENDDDINSGKYERIEFFDMPHYKIGMTLSEYVKSWINGINESTDIMNMFIEADDNNGETSEEKNSDKNIVEEPPAIEDDNSEPESSEEVQQEENPEEPPELDEPTEEPIKEPAEEPQQEEPKEEPKSEKPLSMPKQTDAAEKGKNGVNRKKLYIAFIEWCKEYNNKNTFGSVFDKDIFHNVYPFVPEEMRYFYRLANPILCVLAGDLTFFQVSELRMINKDNSKLDEMMIFAATNDDLRVFNKKDKKVYLATEENGIKLGQVLGETFDLYIQNMIKKGDILNAPPETPNEE